MGTMGRERVGGLVGVVKTLVHKSGKKKKAHILWREQLGKSVKKLEVHDAGSKLDSADGGGR